MLAYSARGRQRTPEEINFQHLVIDIAWFGVSMVASMRFLIVFALRLGASPFEIGLITALPSLIGFLAAPLGSWWLRRFSSSVHAMLLPSLLYRCGMLLLVITPLFPAQLQQEWLIVAVLLPALPQAISGAVFFRVLRDTIYQQRMTQLVSRRSISMNIAIALGALSFGLMLEEVAFPYNYQLMFLISFVAMMLSLWHVSRLQPVVAPPKPAAPQPSASNPWRSRQFLGVVFIVLVSFTSFYAVFPIVPMYLVGQLGVSEGYMAVFTLLELSAGAGIGLISARLAQRLGMRRTAAIGVMGTAAAALVIALAPVPAFALIGAVLTGAAWTIIDVGVYGSFIERTAPDDPHVTTAYAQALALGMFIGPLLGSQVVALGIDPHLALILGAGLRLLASVLIGTEFDFRRLMRLTQRSRA